MNDDIVIRLKEIATEERPLWRSAMVEAADEIERLRQELSNHQLPQRISNAKAIWKTMGFDND